MGLDPEGDTYTGSSVDMNNKEYVKVNGVLKGDVILEELHGRKSVSSIIYFKTDNPARPYYIDNVIIKKIK